MKKLAQILSLITTLFLVHSCSKSIVGSGPVVSETRTSSEFHSINNAGSANVIVLAGSEYKVEIRAQKNIISNIETAVVGQELTIKFKNGVSISSSDEISVYVTCPYYSALSINGSGMIKSEITNSTSSLKLSVTGSGDIDIKNVNITSIQNDIEGSGNIDVAGTTSNALHTINGSGAINCYELSSEDVTANVGGSGSINITVNHHLDATINGSGNIVYKGNPTVNTTINGSGSVRKF